MPYKDPEKRREYMRKYHQKNKEKRKENYLKNQEKLLLQRKENYLKNQEKELQYSKDYYQKNKEKILLQNKQYQQTPKGKKLMRIQHWRTWGVIHPDFDELYEIYLNTKNCELCNVELTEDKQNTKTTRCLDHDHETGLFRNILCNSCNIKRG